MIQFSPFLLLSLRQPIFCLLLLLQCNALHISALKKGWQRIYSCWRASQYSVTAFLVRASTTKQRMYFSYQMHSFHFNLFTFCSWNNNAHSLCIRTDISRLALIYL